LIHHLLIVVIQHAHHYAIVYPNATLMISVSQQLEVNTCMFRETLSLFVCLLLPSMVRGQADTTSTYMQTSTLKEVEITAPKILVVQRGDTIVYNADLIQLAKSAMLRELIKALPEARIDANGIITVRGEPIHELLIEGRDFFNGDKSLALDNFPAFTVQKVKVYRKVPFNAYLTRADGGKKALDTDPMVMNVRLKAKYQNGFIGNSQVAGGLPASKDIEPLYLGHLFGLQYNKRRSIGADVNVNNVNDTGNSNRDGVWVSKLNEEGKIKNTIGRIDYSYTHPETRMNIASWLRLTNREKNTEQESSSMRYLTDGDIFDTSIKALSTESLNAEWNGRFSYPARNVSIQLTPHIDISNSSDKADSKSAYFTEELKNISNKDVIDTIFSNSLSSLRLDSTLIYHQSLESQSRNQNLNISGTGIFNIKLPFLKQVLNASVNYYYNNFHTREHSNNQIIYANGIKNVALELYRRSPSRRSTVNMELRNVVFSSQKEMKRTEVEVLYRINYSQSKRSNVLYHLDELQAWDGIFEWNNLPESDNLETVRDLKNSYETTEWELDNLLEVKALRVFSRKISIGSNFPLQLKKRHIDDYRNKEALALSHNNWLFNPSTWIQYDKYSVGYALSQNLPSLLSLIEREDDSNPTFISIGNPNLRKSSVHRPYFRYSNNIERLRASLSASFEYSYMQDAIKLMSYVDRTTGVTTLQQRNVNGDWDTRMNIRYQGTIGSKRRWRAGINILGEIGKEGSYDHVETDDNTLTHKTSKVLLQTNLELSYQKEQWQFAAKSTGRWRHTESLKHFFHNTNYLDYMLGTTLSTPTWHNLALKTDLTLHLSRGAENKAINQNNLIWNLLARYDLSGHWTFSVEGFDILRQLSATAANSSTQGWSVSSRKVLNSYYMLHVTYRFNIMPK